MAWRRTSTASHPMGRATPDPGVAVVGRRADYFFLPFLDLLSFLLFLFFFAMRKR